jgi:hypothetical protein
MQACLKKLGDRRAKLLTLTMRSSNAPLDVQVKNLWSSYRKLQHRKVWTKNVVGATAVLEITYNGVLKQWHPHLHCVIDANYIPQGDLSNQWLQVTLCSKIVDIRPIRDVRNTAKYVTSYLTKVPEIEGDDEGRLSDELYNTLMSARLHKSTGSFRSQKAEEKTRIKDPGDWVNVAPFYEVLEKANAGDVASQNLLEALERDSHIHEYVDDG